MFGSTVTLMDFEVGQLDGSYCKTVMKALSASHVGIGIWSSCQWIDFLRLR